MPFDFVPFSRQHLVCNFQTICSMLLIKGRRLMLMVYMVHRVQSQEFLRSMKHVDRPGRNSFSQWRTMKYTTVIAIAAVAI